jgi:hypothetical protein
MKEGDRISFTIINNDGHNVYDYTVMPNHLECDDERNDEIFLQLSLEKDEFCRKHYGYEPDFGIWPECSEYDFEALDRVVTKLEELCNIKNRTTIDLHGLYKD